MVERTRSKPADTLAIFGIILTIFVVVFPVTWRLQCALLLVAGFLIVELAFHSRWAIHLPNSYRGVIASVAVAALITISWSPVRLQYQKDQPPDVIPILVSPTEPVIVLINESANVAREIKWGLIVWNLDAPAGLNNPLQIPFQAFDFLRPHERSVPEQLFTAAILSAVKPGNRLFGIATVTCPDCATDRNVWVYIEYGKGGWFAPLPTDKGVSMQQLFRLIPEIEKNISASVDEIVPANQRIPIRLLSD